MAPRPSTQLTNVLHILTVALLASPSLGRLPYSPGSDVVDENNLKDGAPRPLNLYQALRLLLHASQDDTAAGGGQDEDPRMISITDGGLYRGDLVVYLPITVLLPTFAYQSRYSQAGKKKKWDWAWRRHSDQIDNDIDIRGPVDRVLTNQVRYDPHLPEYEGVYGPLLSRIDAYFHYLRVHDDQCRMRAICQLATEGDKYSPLSHLVLSALKKSESIPRPSSYSPDAFRFFRYYWAAERGLAGEACGPAYNQCPADLGDIINMRVLKFWQKLASQVSIKLSDE